jgi:hypothetical protein
MTEWLDPQALPVTNRSTSAPAETRAIGIVPSPSIRDDGFAVPVKHEHLMHYDNVAAERFCR